MTILGSILAAFLASYLTYRFALREKKHGILFTERMRAFQAIQQKLASIKRYCLANEAETDSSEFAPRINDLPQRDQSSALDHWTRLSCLLEEHQHVLPKTSRDAMARVQTQLSMLSSLELALAELNPQDQDNPIVSSAPDAYNCSAESIEKCIEVLYKDLQLPS